MPFKKSPVKRTKGTDILTATEYNRKRADVIEELKNKRINIIYKQGDRNYVYEDSYEHDTMNVNLSSPPAKGIPQRTALWHELSHIIHDSFGAGFFDKADKLANSLVDKIIEMNPTLYHAVNQHNKFNETQVGTNGTPDMVKTSMLEQLKEMYRMSFNTIEDERIESLTGNIWYGTKKMFDKMSVTLGERLMKETATRVLMNGENPIDNPINQLLLIRFKQGHEVSKADHKLFKAIEEVKGTDEFGSIVVWKRYVKPVIDKWFKKHVDDMMNEKEQDISNKISRSEDAADIARKAEAIRQEVDKLSDIPLSEVTKKMREYDNSLDRIGTEATKRIQDNETYIDKSDRVYEKLQQHIYKKRDEIADMKSTAGAMNSGLENELRDMAHACSDQGTNTKTSHDIQSKQQPIRNSSAQHVTHGLDTRLMQEGLDLESDDNDEDDMDNMLSTSFGVGTQQVGQIKNAMSGMSMPKNPSNIHTVERPEKDNKADTVLVNGLRNILTKLKERNVPTLSDTGDEFDEDEYITLKQRGFGDVFKQNKLQNGIDILVSIDGSGSMDGRGNIDEARKLVSSLFKVAQSTPELTVEANVWSSNGQGDVGMTTIKTLNDCKQITTGTVQGGYYETPTHEAMAYSARRLKGMQGRHKMLILITDGYPQYSKNGNHLSNKVIVNACKKSLRKILQVTPNCICINVEPRGYSTVEMLKDIFGKRYVEYSGVKEASNFVSKTLKRKFIEVFRN